MYGDIWILQESTYRIMDGKPEIILFSRNYKNKRETAVHIVPGFRPYFYAPADQIGIKLPNGCEYDETVGIDALGREVCKVMVDIPSTVPKLRSMYTFTDMADILFDKRFLADMGIKYAYTLDIGGTPLPCTVPAILLPRIVYFDIEVRAPEGVLPLPEWCNYPIVSIQTKDSYSGKILIFTNGVPQQDREDHIACSDEYDLYKTFMEYLIKVDPDVLTAWNGDKYDIPYIIRRGKKIGATLKGLGRWSGVKSELEGGVYFNKVTGRSILDMLPAFKKLMIMKGEREAYDLKSVARDYGYEYIDYGAKIDQLMNNAEWSKFLDYGRHDVVALETIDNHEDVVLFSFYETLKSITGCKMDDALYNSRIIETMLMHGGIKPMPTKRFYEEEKTDKFEGAFVLLPPPGLHKNVATVDLSALYPTIMRAFPDETSPDIDGIVIKILNIAVDEREILRAQRKAGDDSKSTELQEYCYKVLANSFYGVIGASTFRLFKRECAEFVTRIGREINKYIHKCCSNIGYTVLYSDTDSTFFKEVKSEEEGKHIEEVLNQALVDWGRKNNAKVQFSIKLEKIYSSLIFKQDSKGKKAAKKRYAGCLIWEDGKGKLDNVLNYKGIELKRSDQARITHVCLRRYLEILLIDGDPTRAARYVKEIYNNVKHGNYGIMDVSIPKAVRKLGRTNNDNPWLRGIRNTKDLFNYNIKDGAKPRLLYLKRDPFEICIDDELDISAVISEDDIDWEQICEKTITMKMQSYIESTGISWNNVIYGQQSLGSF